MLDGEAIRSGICWIWPSVLGMCESVHLDIRAFSSSSNGDIFSLKCCWNGPIKLRSNRHWSFASMKGNWYKLYCVHPKKLWSSFLRSSPSSKLVHPVKSIILTVSSFRYEVMDPCFVYSNESTQKFIWITLKHLQTLFCRHTVALMVHSEQTRHLANSFFTPIIRAKLKSLPCDMSVVSTSSRTFTRRSVKTISWILSMITMA